MLKKNFKNNNPAYTKTFSNFELLACKTST